MKKLMVSSLVLLVLSACSSTPTDKTDAANDKNPSTAADAAKPSANTNAADANNTAGKNVNPLKDPNNILSKRSVYFDLDSFVVKEEYKNLVSAHSKYLAGNRSARMTIQGNTDERGSREYNLALGQKRADAVKKQMTLQGAGEPQIETVSFGKEKPKAQGHDEAAWAENRRADVIYAGE